MPDALVSKVLTAPKFKYSQLIKAGPNYICSGMVALDNETGELIAGEAGQQTKKIFENLHLLMQEFDLCLQDLASVRIFTTQFDRFAEINTVWEDVFKGDIRPPARSAVGVSALPLNAKVEIEFLFYRD
ncbi:RidA family protein [Gammaproteobacteria bacterium]|nr:RidA family protein [Gammaproteobacteria bacterium]